MSEKQLTEGKKKWENLKMPHTLVIIFLITAAAVLLTWIIPAGEYIRTQNADGITVVDPNSFHYIENQGVNPIQIASYMVEGFKGAASLVCFILRGNAVSGRKDCQKACQAGSYFHSCTYHDVCTDLYNPIHRNLYWICSGYGHDYDSVRI